MNIRLRWQLGLVAVLSIAIPVACNSSRSTGTKTPTLEVKSGENGKPSTSKDHPALGEAGSFFILLQSKNTKGARDLVATAFRKELSGPLTFEAEKLLGYSDSDTEKYLSDTFGDSSDPKVSGHVIAPSGNAVSIRGHLKSKGPRVFALRMAKEGEAWKVSRFTTAAIQGSATPNGSSDAELLWARETALDFLELLVGGPEDHFLTLNLLTESYKAKLPAPSVADPGLKYAKQDVRNWLNKVRGGANGFAVTSQNRGDGGYVFAGDLVGPGKSASFRMVLVAEGDSWKVQNLEIKS